MRTSDFVEISKFLVERFDKLLESKTAKKGNIRKLLEELKENSTAISLFEDGEVAVGKVAEKLSTKIYDELNSSGFNFNTVGKRKIRDTNLLKRQQLSSWEGQPTGRLITNIYDKIKDFSVRYSMAGTSTKYRWGARLKNIQVRILVLLRNIKD